MEDRRRRQQICPVVVFGGRNSLHPNLVAAVIKLCWRHEVKSIAKWLSRINVRLKLRSSRNSAGHGFARYAGRVAMLLQSRLCVNLCFSSCNGFRFSWSLQGHRPSHQSHLLFRYTSAARKGLSVSLCSIRRSKRGELPDWETLSAPLNSGVAVLQREHRP